LIGAATENSIPIIGKWIGGARTFLKEQKAERLNRALERVLTNPDHYRAIASMMPPADRKLLDKALNVILVESGAITRTGGLGTNVSTPALNRRDAEVPVE
jgi:hypothetical protein